MDFKIVEDKIIELGKYALQNWQQLEVTHKEDNVDVVTQVDMEIEQKFYDFVQEQFPEHGFVGEEHENLRSEAEYTWLIDPIDGTKYYANHVPLWSVTATLLHKNEPVWGIVYQPTSDDVYLAEQGKGAFLNGNRIECKQGNDLSKIELAYIFSPKPDYKQDLIELSAELMQHLYRVRILGSVALSLAWLGSGHFGLYFGPFTPESKRVDISAGLLIAQEAGAITKRVDAGGGREHVIVGRAEVVEQVVKLIPKK